MYYPMLKHGIDQLCIRLAPLSVVGNVGGSVLGISTGFASDILKQMSEPVRYYEEHNNTQ